VIGCEGRGEFKVLAGFGQLSLVKERQGKAVVGGIVIGIDVETAAEGGSGLWHVTAVVVGDPQVVISQYKCRRGCHCPAIVFDGQIQQTFVKRKDAELVVAEDVIGLGVEQMLELLPCLPQPSLAFMRQRQEQALVNRCVSEKASALGAELIS